VLEASGVSHNEDWWVVVDELRVRKWCQVRAAAILRSCTDEPNRSWNDRGDQQLVVGCRGTALRIWIDVDVIVLQ